MAMATTSCSSDLQCSNIPSDRRCSNEGGRMSMFAHLYHPDRLIDPRCSPTIYLGLLSIPGPLLPLIISVAFVFYKIAQYKARRNREVEIEIEVERLPPTPRQNSLQWPDLRHPDALRIYAARANLLFHGVVTNGAIMHFGQSFLENDTLCCVEAVALLLYADIVKPQVRKSCLAAAVGWTLYTYLDQLPHMLAFIATGLTALLAAPLAWQIDGTRFDVEYQQSLSGLLLMLMAANRMIFDSQVTTQQWTKDFPMDAWKYLSSIYVVNGVMILMFNRTRGTSHQNIRWALYDTIAFLKRWAPSAFEALISVVVFFGTFVGGIVCTAYLSSCLPWSRLVFGKCASTPALSLFSLTAGFAVYPSIFLIIHSIRQHGRAGRLPTAVLWGSLEICANVIGWACLFLNILFVVLGMLSYS